jgi:glycerol kinase
VAELLDGLAALVPLAGTVAAEGPLTRNPCFCQFLADAAGRAIAVCPGGNLRGLGAALLARHGAGLGGDLPPAPSKRHFAPQGTLDATLRARFRDALERVRGWRQP